MSCFMDQTELETNKEPLAIPRSALLIHESIVRELESLLALQVVSPLESSFRIGFEKILSLFELYQNRVVVSNGNQVTCGKGCSWCCFHWVEDVNSFEAEIIADFIKKQMTLEQVKNIAATCREDEAALERLDNIINEKIAQLEGEREIDTTLLLLSSYYQLERPCPLLGPDGSCSVYPVRPLTCRVYMSFSDPVRCAPANINDGEVVTYILDLEEKANAIIDKLHFRFCRFEGDTGLRSALLKYLTN